MLLFMLLWFGTGFGCGFICEKIERRIPVLRYALPPAAGMLFAKSVISVYGEDDPLTVPYTVAAVVGYVVAIIYSDWIDGGGLRRLVQKTSRALRALLAKVREQAPTSAPKPIPA